MYFVLYNEYETRLHDDLGPAFWSNKEGWTDLKNSTKFSTYVNLPHHAIPMPYKTAQSLKRLFEITEQAEIA